MPSPDDARLATQDAAIPGLPLLFDPQAFGTRLSRSLGRTINWCTCDYLRYKPATNCLAQFTVGIEGEAAQLYVRAHSRDTEAKLSKFAAGSTRSPATGRERLVWSDVGVGIAFFPDDHRLPNLPRLLAPESRNEVLSRVIEPPLGLDDTTLVTLAYKPERRYVCRLDGGDRPRAVLKLYSRESFAHVARSAKLIQ
ncbi:MAG: hypothetical protein OER86_13365, partial [Phycisphaerae bacterium]|nr:hypothetical protein [Phycisphaerae bacterium]